MLQFMSKFNVKADEFLTYLHIYFAFACLLQDFSP